MDSHLKYLNILFPPSKNHYQKSLIYQLKILIARCLETITYISFFLKTRIVPQIMRTTDQFHLHTVLCKIMERNHFKYVKTQTTSLLVINQVFNPKITINQFVEIYNIIISNLVHGKDVIFVFCDIFKASDEVRHKCLLFKLERFGFKGTHQGGQKIIYSTDVKRSYQKDFPLVKNAGVSQGSVLGPFLFLIYIDISENQIRFFEDDTSSMSCHFTNNIDKIILWSEQWLETDNVNFYIYFIHRFGRYLR